MKMAEPVKAFGWAARDSSGNLSPFNFTRRATAERDVQFKVLYCGICHSDLHTIKNDWGFTDYPIVPGHEIVGVVTEVGSKVKKFKAGDKVGVGCLVNSCRRCDHCAKDLENYCFNPTFTCGTPLPEGGFTQGGFSDIMLADEDCLIRWPENFPMDRGAPLLCAGITTYSSLKHYGLDKPGMNIGVVGLGGLGHVAVKFAKAFGAIVTVISTSPEKKKEALENLGADAFIQSSEAGEMQGAARTLDGIVNTVSSGHSVAALLELLKLDGEMVMLGGPNKPLEVPVFGLIMGRRKLGGSMTGGIKETQEMIDFAAKHNIAADIEMISMDYVNKAMERLEKGDVKYRFVINVHKSFNKEE